jgi:7-cyano-7-deazaguanine synthase
MKPMAEAITAGTYADLEVLRPFIHLRKEGIAALGASLGIDFSLTWSCYKGGEIHCGKCGTCVERKEAFEKAGLEDPTEYEGEPEQG